MYQKASKKYIFTKRSPMGGPLLSISSTRFDSTKIYLYTRRGKALSRIILPRWACYCPTIIPSPFWRRFFVWGSQFESAHERASPAFIQICHFRSSDEPRLQGQKWQRNNPVLFDGRPYSLVLSKMAQNETMYYPSRIYALHGEKRRVSLIFHFVEWLSFWWVRACLLS